MADKIRVLVVDDSALMRKKISDLINSDDELEVIGTARNGEEAVREVLIRQPDVITLDIEMPRMDGLNALGYIMSERPTPVIMLSAYTKYGSHETISALEYGAVDFVLKPSGVISLDIGKVKNELLSKIKLAAGISIDKIKLLLPPAAKREKISRSESLDKLVVIGASTGGPRALSEVIPRLPGDLPAGVLIVQHMPPDFTKSLGERLNFESELTVKEAEDDEPIEPGKVLLAPGDFHMVVKKGKQRHFVALNKDPEVHNVRPSVSVTMISAAPVYQDKTIGVILTGMGSDGVEGMSAIKHFNGKTLAEDKSTAVVNGMPKAAIDQGVVDKVVPLFDIAKEIERLVKNG
jgi:two-component system chemotaxis response regulator CheB